MRALSNKKVIIPIIIVTLALVGGGLYYWYLRTNESKTTSRINFEPPTKEEKQQAEDNKERIVQKEQEQSTPPPTDGRKTVTPIITSAEPFNGIVEVSGYVPGVFEDGGTCTATFVKGSSQVTKQSKGVKNVSNTQCNGLDAAISELSPGTWTVTLSYSSATAQGSSAGKAVEVN